MYKSNGSWTRSCSFWESQNSTSTDSPVGQRYLHHRELGSHVVLFVRDTDRRPRRAAPLLCLGQASYVEHRGERPIAITWRLHRPMPADTFTSERCGGATTPGRGSGLWLQCVIWCIRTDTRGRPCTHRCLIPSQTQDQSRQAISGSTCMY
ncbi:MAG: DUF3427 domain-containing protein [Haloechinothrix sp.]